MKKRWLIIFTTFILIASISFISAQIPTGIGDFLDAFGGENLLLIGSFVISFVLINFILGRLPVFKDKITGKKNKKVPGVIAFIVSLFIVYGLNKFDFDLASFFSSLGVGQGLLELIATIAVLAGIIFLLWKFKSLVFLISGVILIGISFTDWVFESESLLIVGIILIIIWILIKIFFRKKKPKPEEFPSESYINPVDRQSQIAREQYEQERRRRELERSRTAQRLWNERGKRKEAEKRQLQEQKSERQRRVAQEEQQGKIREARQRTASELQNKYNQYRTAAKEICVRIGHIPKKGTSEYNRWKHYTNAVKAIENMAKKQRITLS